MGTGVAGLAAVGGVMAAALTGASIWACVRFMIVADRPDTIQAVHRQWAPRVGGIPLLLTVVALAALWPQFPERQLMLGLVACALPAFCSGFIEDLTGEVGPKLRLAATFVSAALAWFALGAKLTAVSMPLLDPVLGTYSIAAFVFTAFAVAGVAHSVNIIDGFNGLSACFCLIAFATFFVIANIVGDTFIQGLSLLYCGALVGFLIWNFPFGRIFLGDGGAYFLGFSLAEVSVLLVERNPQVSPWFCLLVLIYPVWDTLFSFYRRQVVRGTSWSRADTLHLHHLVYRRLVRPYRLESSDDIVACNAITSVYLWGLSLLAAIPAVLYWDRPLFLVGFTLLFGLTYVLLYRRLVHFRAPSLLLLPSRRSPIAIARTAAVDRGLPPR